MDAVRECPARALSMGVGVGVGAASEHQGQAAFHLNLCLSPASRVTRHNG